MDILRIATAGSVDDGKSTLIGRLLYDTKSITKDKLDAVSATSKRKGLDFTDLSLLTDGLIAEREQGITIDVAHIYFSTEMRKYIIADTPGHVEYTRNMITGASTAQASIVLIDARNGVIEQTRRHLFISSLLRIETVFVCINKMDLVHFDESVFLSIENEMKELANKIGYKGESYFIPIAARHGDNVVHQSLHMNWYKGKTLLQYMEGLPVHQKDDSLPTRFPVQFVIRPHSAEHHDFRGFAGKLISGVLHTGQEVLILPTQKKSKIKTILMGEKKVAAARAGESIVVELHDEVDLSRGNMLVPAISQNIPVNDFTATLCWMDEQPMNKGTAFLLQHGVNAVKAKITSILSVLDIKSMESSSGVGILNLNDIGMVTLKTAKPVFADLYKENRYNGAFILIDEFTNNTVGAGFFESY